MLNGVQGRTINGPTIVINCPACGAERVDADTFEYGERLTLLHVVPLTPFSRNFYVKCGKCSEQFSSPIAPAELEYLLPNELQAVLRRHVGLVPAFLAIVGLLLSPLPIIGLVMAIISLAVNGFRQKHWTRFVSRLSVGFALVVSAFFSLMALWAAIFEK